MKNKFLLQTILVCITIFSQNTGLKAQWVTIPDSNFVLFLQENYPTCMNGNQMDTTCSEIVNETILGCSSKNINQLDGIQYFDSLEILECYFNYITSLPTLPQNLTYLACASNQITSLPELPQTLSSLICSGNQLSFLPELPLTLNKLYCGENQLSFLPELPLQLNQLYCQGNQLSILPALPEFLSELNIDDNLFTVLPLDLPSVFNLLSFSNNQITDIGLLPQHLNYLYCSSNFINFLPELPYNLQQLECDNNQITVLPLLPESLVTLKCENNLLTSLPLLPPTLYQFDCSYNQISSLPELPSSLYEINCQYNLLSNLPTLTQTYLSKLNCSHNQLTSLPSLPQILFEVACNDNQLTSLPTFPTNCYSFNCANNQITCFPIFGDLLSAINASNNPFTCLPNYTFFMTPDLLVYPLCQEGDFINNPNNCEGAKGITGSIYKDVNADCINNTFDLPCQNIPVQLFDESDNLITTYYSSIDGSYNMYQFSGTYKVAIDTLNKPYTVSCPEIGIDSTVVLDENNTLVDNINFAIECKPGFDLKVQSIAQTGWVFPGLQHQVNVVAGDILSFYNLNCVTGVGGTVQINVNGPVVYDGIASGALVPDAIVGNSFAYNIGDFGTLSSNSFVLLFLTDTTAQAGETVCITASITPDEIDNDTTNNTLTYCYPVTNSYDPNEKEVYPTSVLPNYDGYFTYTIHFQNTGTAPAVNIKVQDTLSTYLDLSTFEITAYSHPNNTTLTGNLISFKFPNIWLPDSTSNLEGSKGFVQYRIKPLPSLPVGTQITNTAYIYFDYNDPIQTNITTSNFEIINGIKAYSKGKVSIYPNPNNGMFHVNLVEKNQNEKTLELTNLLGEKVWSQKTKSNSTTIDINYLPKGIYILNITDSSSHFTERIIKN